MHARPRILCCSFISIHNNFQCHAPVLARCQARDHTTATTSSAAVPRIAHAQTAAAALLYALVQMWTRARNGSAVHTCGCARDATAVGEDKGIRCLRAHGPAYTDICIRCIHATYVESIEDCVTRAKVCCHERLCDRNVCFSRPPSHKPTACKWMQFSHTCALGAPGY